MRTRATIVMAILVVLAMALPTSASPSPGVFVGGFQCQLIIFFPVPPLVPAKTNCDGAAWGVGAGTGKGGSIFTAGVEPSKGLIATGPLIAGKKPAPANCAKPPADGCQGKFENFEAYNILYGEPIFVNGIAEGYAFINGNDPVSGGKSTVAHFSYVRLGVVFVAALDRVNAYNNKWAQGGGPKPVAGGTGAAAGIFSFKPPIGTAIAPNPQQHVVLTGLVTMQF